VTPGALARRVLGRRFNVVGEFYRGLFVDMQCVVDAIEPLLPPGAHCLDIGAGDGLVTNMLLERREDLRFTLIDVAPSIGGFIRPEFAARVTLRPATGLGELIAEGFRCDAMLMTDVLHHIPLQQRGEFFQDLAALSQAADCPLIVVKDLEPGGPRAMLAVLSDKYVTGDLHVSLISRDRLRAIVTTAFGPERLQAFETSVPDHPNYCAVIRLRGPDGTPPGA